MKELDKAIKTYWYSRGFNKVLDVGGCQIELDAFSEGWKASLGWVKDECIYTEEDGHKCISQGMIDEELNE